MILEGKVIEVNSDKLKFESEDKVYRIDLVANTRVTDRGRLTEASSLKAEQTVRITGPTAGWSQKVVTALLIDILE